MRWKAVALVAMLLVSGCISGDESAGEPEELETREANESAEQNAGSANASNNSTYLKNTDYNQTHVHDYWPGEATEKILMDDTVEARSITVGVQEGAGGFGATWFSLPNGSFVPVGTGKLIVEVDATSALLNGDQALAYQARGQDEYTHMDAQGAEATWEIEVEPGMVDVPHARSTEWYFQLRADGAGSVMNGEINVKITAEKTRSLEAWPEHPDFWDGGNKTELDVGTMETDFDELDLGFNIYLGDIYDSEEDETTVPLPEGELVPPETEVLYVQFWYQLDGDAKNEVNGDVTPLVQTGATSGWYESMEWAYQINATDGYKEYAIPVGSDSWDSPYAEESAWSFQVDAPTGVRNVPIFNTDLNLGITETGSGNVTFELTAYRELPPWLEEAMGEDEDDEEASTARALDAEAASELAGAR